MYGAGLGSASLTRVNALALREEFQRQRKHRVDPDPQAEAKDVVHQAAEQRRTEWRRHAATEKRATYTDTVLPDPQDFDDEVRRAPGSEVGMACDVLLAQLWCRGEIRFKSLCLVVIFFLPSTRLRLSPLSRLPMRLPPFLPR